MFIGLKCKECKYKCHRDCASKVPPSCGLPQELIDEFKRTLQADSQYSKIKIIISKYFQKKKLVIRVKTFPVKCFCFDGNLF